MGRSSPIILFRRWNIEIRLSFVLLSSIDMGFCILIRVSLYCDSTVYSNYHYFLFEENQWNARCHSNILLNIFDLKALFSFLKIALSNFEWKLASSRFLFHYIKFKINYFMTKCISNGFHRSNIGLTFHFEPNALHEKKQQLTAVMTTAQNV